MHLTQVTTRCSIWGHGRLSPDDYRIREAFLDRRCLPAIHLLSSLAGRIRLPSMHGTEWLDDREKFGGLHGLRLSRLCDSRNDFREYPQAVDVVVPSYLVDDVSENGNQCSGFAEGSWFGQLQDRVDVVAQIATCYGATRPRSIVWTSGG